MMPRSPRLRPWPARRIPLIAAMAASACLTAPATAQDASGYLAATSPPPRAQRTDIAPVLRQGQVDLLATIRQRGSLRACVVPVPPMVQRDARGQWIGFSIDLARQLAEDMGVSLDISPSNWVDVMPDLLHRQCDAVITGLWRSTQRALVVNFTQPTATEGVYLIAQRQPSPSRTFPQGYNREDSRIGILDDPLHRQVLRERFPKANAVVIDESRMLDELAAGHIHGALLTTLAPEVLLREHVQRLHLPSREPLAQTSAAIAIRKGDPDFLNFLDTWLAIQRESGWLDERARRWSQPQR